MHSDSLHKIIDTILLITLDDPGVLKEFLLYCPKRRPTILKRIRFICEGMGVHCTIAMSRKKPILFAVLICDKCHPIRLERWNKSGYRLERTN